MAKKETGFYFQNTVEVTAPDGSKHRVFKGDVDAVKKGFSKIKGKKADVKK